MIKTRRERILAAEAASAAFGCPVAERLREYHEKSLSPEAYAVIERHIASCEACAEALRFLEEAPGAAEAVVPMDVEARSETFLQAVAGPPRRGVTLAWPRLLQAAAAVIFVGAVGIVG